MLLCSRYLASEFSMMAAPRLPVALRSQRRGVMAHQDRPPRTGTQRDGIPSEADEWHEPGARRSWRSTTSGPARPRSTRSDALALVRAVSTLAHALGMEVHAEGVETDQQLARLLEADCDRGQGYLFSRPVTGEAMSRLLQHDLPLTASIGAPFAPPDRAPDRAGDPAQRRLIAPAIQRSGV